ncbi:hypothetical protein HZS_2288 [Henneguya salminicola]|nr:hypothetical protein HZS_2288 [Henneguya salminicola]
MNTKSSTRGESVSLSQVFRNSERHKKEIEKLNSNFTKKLKVANKVDPKKLEEEKIINISLSANQDSLKETIKTLEKKYTKLETESTAKISQLQEEIHDLMAHFEMSANIQSLDKNVKDYPATPPLFLPSATATIDLSFEYLLSL